MYILTYIRTILTVKNYKAQQAPKPECLLCFMCPSLYLRPEHTHFANSSSLNSSLPTASSSLTRRTLKHTQSLPLGVFTEKSASKPTVSIILNLSNLEFKICLIDHNMRSRIFRVSSFLLNGETQNWSCRYSLPTTSATIIHCILIMGFSPTFCNSCWSYSLQCRVSRKVKMSVSYFRC